MVRADVVVVPGPERARAPALGLGQHQVLHLLGAARQHRRGRRAGAHAAGSRRDRDPRRRRHGPARALGLPRPGPRLGLQREHQPVH